MGLFREGDGLLDVECLRLLPTSPFFTPERFGRSSSEEEDDPESEEDC